MKIIIVFFLIATLLWGCSGSFTVRTHDDLNNALNHKSGTIHLVDSLSYEAEDFQRSGDSISFTDQSTGLVKIVSLRDISQINCTNHGEVVVQGLTTTVALLGFESLFLSPFWENTHGSWGAQGIVTKTAIIGATGTLVGALIGSHSQYVFDRDSLKIEELRFKTFDRDTTESVSAMKKVIKAGIEIGTSGARDHAGFSTVPGFSVGFLTGIDLSHSGRIQCILGLEASYDRLIEYQSNVPRDHIIYPYLYRSINDERVQLSFLELGVLPEFVYSISKDLSVGLHVGASIGFGTEQLSATERSNTLIG
jgi:hypothetical protein